MALTRADAIGIGIVLIVALVMFLTFGPIILALWGLGPLADNVDMCPA